MMVSLLSSLVILSVLLTPVHIDRPSQVPTPEESWRSTVAFLETEAFDKNNQVALEVIKSAIDLNVTMGYAPSSDDRRVSYNSTENMVIINAKYIVYNQVVVATLFAFGVGYAQSGTNRKGCLDRYVDAFDLESRFWASIVGAGGKNPPGDTLEAEFNSLLEWQRQGKLKTELSKQTAIRERCQLTGTGLN